ncbi:hypothetical protein X975_09925, partial [Stegodyphus mimosarum]
MFVSIRFKLWFPGGPHSGSPHGMECTSSSNVFFWKYKRVQMGFTGETDTREKLVRKSSAETVSLRIRFYPSVAAAGA